MFFHFYYFLSYVVRRCFSYMCIALVCVLFRGTGASSYYLRWLHILCPRFFVVLFEVTAYYVFTMFCCSLSLYDLLQLHMLYRLGLSYFGAIHEAERRQQPEVAAYNIISLLFLVSCVPGLFCVSLWFVLFCCYPRGRSAPAATGDYMWFHVFLVLAWSTTCYKYLGRVIVYTGNGVSANALNYSIIWVCVDVS